MSLRRTTVHERRDKWTKIYSLDEVTEKQDFKFLIDMLFGCRCCMLFKWRRKLRNPRLWTCSQMCTTFHRQTFASRSSCWGKQSKDIHRITHQMFQSSCTIFISLQIVSINIIEWKVQTPKISGCVEEFKGRNWLSCIASHQIITQQNLY